MVKPSFLHIIRKVNGVDPKKVIFTFKELTHHLSEYILQNRYKFFDKRNHMVAICEGDILAEAFGVRAFHRSQVTNLLKAQLIPYRVTDTSAEKQKSEKMDPEDSIRSSAKLSRDKGASRKRCPQESSEDETEDEGNNCKSKTQGTESSASYQFVKRQRRRTSSRERSRSISVTVTTFDYSSSGDETIYS